MNPQNFYLNKKNDMYVYFESIVQILPSTVLDIGMFLKRIGTISSQALDQTVPRSCTLDGVDLLPEKKLPVYQTIYHDVRTYDSFLAEITSGNQKETIRQTSYDLVSLLYIDRLLPVSEIQRIWEWISTHCRYAVTNYNPDIYRYFNGCKAHNDFHVNADSYSIITFR